jgi:hypothetical protein
VVNQATEMSICESVQLATALGQLGKEVWKRILEYGMTTGGSSACH